MRDPMHAAATHSPDNGAAALNKQSTIEWAQVTVDLRRNVGDAERARVTQGSHEPRRTLRVGSADHTVGRKHRARLGLSEG
jgi:hypothetical protein